MSETNIQRKLTLQNMMKQDKLTRQVLELFRFGGRIVPQWEYIQKKNKNVV